MIMEAVLKVLIFFDNGFEISMQLVNVCTSWRHPSELLLMLCYLSPHPVSGQDLLAYLLKGLVDGCEEPVSLPSYLVFLCLSEHEIHLDE